MRPTTALDDNVFNFANLLHPGIRFEHPMDMVSHSGLAEKRAMLASWGVINRTACGSLKQRTGLGRIITIRMEIMFEANLARIRTHRNNIHRFRDLLRTELSDFDRKFIKKPMSTSDEHSLMRGSECSRNAARYKAQRALFLLLCASASRVARFPPSRLRRSHRLSKSARASEL